MTSITHKSHAPLKITAAIRMLIFLFSLAATLTKTQKAHTKKVIYSGKWRRRRRREKKGRSVFGGGEEQNSVRQKRRRRRTWSGWKEKRKRGQNPDLLRNTLLLLKRNEDCVDSLSTFFWERRWGSSHFLLLGISGFLNPKFVLVKVRYFPLLNFRMRENLVRSFVR